MDIRKERTRRSALLVADSGILPVGEEGEVEEGLAVAEALLSGEDPPLFESLTDINGTFLLQVNTMDVDE